MEQAKFEIGVFHDEIRSIERADIIKMAKEKMTLKFSYSFAGIDERYFNIHTLPEKKLHLVSLEIWRMKAESKFCTPETISDLCSIYLTLKEKGKL